MSMTSVLLEVIWSVMMLVVRSVVVRHERHVADREVNCDVSVNSCEVSRMADVLRSFVRSVVVIVRAGSLRRLRSRLTNKSCDIS